MSTKQRDWIVASRWHLMLSIGQVWGFGFAVFGHSRAADIFLGPVVFSVARI